MELGIAGKRALVLGASRGLGRHRADRHGFAGAGGWRVDQVDLIRRQIGN
jgi:NAD(P)-dependent dehydrogenase (short-subunit alcohol dehydrogenase family)